MARLDAGLSQHRVAHGLRLAAEAAAHVVLAAERLHHLDADDRLVGRFGDVALSLLHLPRDRRYAPCEPESEHGDRRHRDRGVQREACVDDDEDDACADDHHHALDPLDEAPADEVADRVQIVRRAGEHLAGRVPIVERARVAQVRAVQQLAHPRLDPDADARGRVAAEEVDEETDDAEREDAEQVRPQRLHVADDGAVDRPLQQDRDRRRDERVREREAEADRTHAALAPPEVQQPAERRQQAEVRRVDGIHVLGHEKRRGPPRPQPSSETN